MTDDQSPPTDGDEPTDTTWPTTPEASAPEPAPPAGPPPAAPPPAPTPPPAGAVPGAPPPVPGGPSRTDSTNWATGAHLSALVAAAVVGLSVLGPLVVWLVKRDEDAFVGAHALEALNFQLTWLIGSIVGTVVGVVLAIVTVGFGLFLLLPLALVVAVLWIVFVIKGALAASRGQTYRYPATVRLIS